MIRRPPRSTRTDTLFPYPTLCRSKAAELAEQHGWFLARQFENPANPAYHRQTTAAEILRDFAGKPLDYFVSGWGTGGTLTGVGQVLKVARPDVRIVAAEPSVASLPEIGRAHV